METSSAVEPGDELLAELGYYTEHQVCGLLGIKLQSARNRPHTLPPAYKLGKRKVYRRSEVEAWIRRQRVSRAAA